jgi:hypothetical protein
VQSHFTKCAKKNQTASWMNPISLTITGFDFRNAQDGNDSL